MPLEIANSQLPVSRNCDLIKDSMLQPNGLPLAEVIERHYEFCGKFQITNGRSNNDSVMIDPIAVDLYELYQTQVLHADPNRARHH